MGHPLLEASVCPGSRAQPGSGAGRGKGRASPPGPDHTHSRPVHAWACAEDRAGSEPGVGAQAAPLRAPVCHWAGEHMGPSLPADVGPEQGCWGACSPGAAVRTRSCPGAPSRPAQQDPVQRGSGLGHRPSALLRSHGGWARARDQVSLSPEADPGSTFPPHQPGEVGGHPLWPGSFPRHQHRPGRAGRCCPEPPPWPLPKPHPTPIQGPSVSPWLSPSSKERPFCLGHRR